MTPTYRDVLISAIDFCQDVLTEEEERVRREIKAHVKEYQEKYPDWITKTRLEYLQDTYRWADLSVLWYQHRHRIAMGKNDMTSAAVMLLMAKDAKETRERTLREMETEANKNKTYGVKDDIDPKMIERAKDFPFDELLAQYGWKGRNGMYVCEFHADKDASFHVRKRDNRARCFGCGWRKDQYADTIDFLVDLEGISFSDAVRRLQ